MILTLHPGGGLMTDGARTVENASDGEHGALETPRPGFEVGDARPAMAQAAATVAADGERV
jgi:hypothetical protein